ncbi:MAG: Ig-like domain-containing protein, partial [Bacteroidales bacterium]|nr:Ig-like domain-containing protein [Bacteroidales bacterium]
SNNYLPGVGDTPRTSSRFYTNSILTITPGAGYSIKKIEFVATTEGYVTALKNSTWTNASASASGTLVTVTPTDGTSELSALIKATCGFTLVKVFYETAALIPVTGVTVDNSTLRILKGATAQLNATIAPANASNKKVNWTSTNNSVATVSASGLVTAVAAGTATVTATTADGGFTANCTVTVYQANWYKKVTTAPSDWSGTYLIVYETGNVAFNGGLETLDVAENTIDVTISNGKIEANSTTNAASFTVTSKGNGKYSIKSASGLYIGQSSYSNGLKTNSDDIYDNTLSTSGIECITTGGNVSLKYNKASDQKRFRYYKSGQQDIQLYILSE